MTLGPCDVSDADERRRRYNAAAQRKWQAANPDKVKALNRKKYLATRDKWLGRVKLYAEQNKDKIKSYQKAYAASPEGRAVRMNAEYRRRAKIRSSDSCATNAQVRTLIANATNCKYCNEGFDLLRRPTLDHVIPLSKGGSHSLKNLTAACAVCNGKKGARLDYAVGT